MRRAAGRIWSSRSARRRAGRSTSPGPGLTRCSSPTASPRATRTGDGVAVVQDSLALNGGTIRTDREGADNEAVILRNPTVSDADRRVDGVSPTAISARVAGPDLTVTFSEPLDRDSAPAAGAGGFAVAIDGGEDPAVTVVSVSGPDGDAGAVPAGAGRHDGGDGFLCAARGEPVARHRRQPGAGDARRRGDGAAGHQGSRAAGTAAGRRGQGRGADADLRRAARAGAPDAAVEPSGLRGRRGAAPILRSRASRSASVWAATG